MFIHFADCPVWLDADPDACSCPRLWRVRIDRQHPVYRYRVFKRDDDGAYPDEPMVRTTTLHAAMAMVERLSAIAARYAGIAG